MRIKTKLFFSILLIALKLSLHSQTIHQKLSKEFFTEVKNNTPKQLYSYFDTSAWGKLLAFQTIRSLDQLKDECGAIITIDKISVDTLGCKIATATEIKTTKGKFYYYLLFNQNQKVERFNADTFLDKPFYVAELEKSVTAFKRELILKTSDKIKLPATLFLPGKGGKYPLAIFVHGSGPNDRYETVGKNKIFMDFALGLLKKGIAVLLYDKRTYVYQFNNPLPNDSMTYYEETIEDAITAVAASRTLQEVDATKIFIVGHSLGAMCAPQIAELSPSLAGIAMLAGPARPLLEIIPEQIDYINNLDKVVTQQEEFQANAIKWQVKNAMSENLSLKTKSGTLPYGIGPKYWMFDKKYKPTQTAKNLKLPILLLQGERDFNVTKKDYDLWVKEMTGKANFSSKLYPKLNHLFFEGEGPATPEDSMDPDHVADYVMEDLANWIKSK